MRYRRWMPGAFAVFALLLAACGSSSSAGSASGTSSAAAPSASSQSSASTTAMLKSAKTSLGTVLANSKGMTLYWFAIDTPTSSKCSGTCLTYWPAVTGTPQAASGVKLPGKLGTITRSDGTKQATYDSHPLYTYSGDTAPGQTSGNKVNGSGGLWYAVTLSASTTSTSSTASSGSGSAAGGYGY